MKDTRFVLPPNVLTILQRLHISGYEAYIVGGCVRDILLGRIPLDFDIATSALPSEVGILFERVIPTGLKHGTLSVVLDNVSYEVTTFRMEGEYENARVPKSVKFVRELKEDIKRRDFTINALAYAPHTGLIDMVGGEEDLKKRQIVCVGDAYKRFSEDALRILRALRFASVLCFDIQIQTHEALLACMNKLSLISSERIKAEFDKLLIGKNIDYVMWHYREVFRIVMPKIVQDGSFKDMCLALRNLSVYENYKLSWIGVFYNRALMEIDDCKRLMNTLRFSKKEMEYVLRGVGIAHKIQAHITESKDIFLQDTKKKAMLRKLLAYEGLELLRAAMCVCLAYAQNKEHIRYIQECSVLLEEIYRDEGIFDIKNLAINGRDLIALGIPQGKRIGEILSLLFDCVLEGSMVNTREILIEKALAICAKI